MHNFNLFVAAAAATTAQTATNNWAANKSKKPKPRTVQNEAKAQAKHRSRGQGIFMEIPSGRSSRIAKTLIKFCQISDDDDEDERG